MRRSLARAWPVLLGLLVLAPLLRPGYVLSYDMVFVPDQSWRSDYLGLGVGLPRAVPSDAVVSALSVVLPGDVIQKLALAAVMLGAGFGMHVLMRRAPLVARLAAVSWYVWNPYVAERLMIGQWVVLLGYAALPWVLAASVSARRGSWRASGEMVVAVGIAALSASGGLLAAALALAAVLAPGSAASWRQRLAVGAGCVAVNAPWLTAGLLHHDDVSTGRDAVEAFAASSEGHLPAVAAVLGLGGIWNADVVPASRLGWVAVIWLVVVLAAVVLGVPAAIRYVGPALAAAVALVAVGCVVVALAGTVDAGLVARLSDDVPGLALLRDGPRYLGGLALLEAVCFGFGAAALAALPAARPAGGIAAVGLVLAPLAVMPDLAWGVGGNLSPVDYPASWAAARAAMVADGADGRVLVLPDAPYRAYAWNDRRPGLDPASRYFPHPMLVSDALTVDGVQVQDDDITTAVASSLFDLEVRDELERLDVRYVVVDVDPATTRLKAARLGATVVYSSDDIDVYRLAAEGGYDPSASRVAAVVGAWSLAGLAAVAAAAVAIPWRSRRSRRSRRAARSK